MTPNSKTTTLNWLKTAVIHYLENLYPEDNHEQLCQQIFDIMLFDENISEVSTHINLWNEKDIIVITYANSIYLDDEIPLKTLRKFFNAFLIEQVSIVHLLPFFPYSSDDGFSVINYMEVNHSMGNWEDIRNLSKNYKIMADLVLNHCSSRSLWFDNYKQNKQPGDGFFIECDVNEDLSHVVRPRTSPLLKRIETLNGEKHVWCTFSHDQIDLNFKNSQVLLEFIRIIKYYLDQGISFFRLDAVAFLWKEISTSCINLQQTHDVIRLLRLLIEHHNPDAVVITETNIPNRENLSYFGNANEAHLIYNFTLPPLILYTMLSEDSSLLKQWMMSMPPAQNGTCYFNFIASHDGIGLRPVEGILSNKKVDEIAAIIKKFEGEVSWRTATQKLPRPYELNISLIDAFKGTFDGIDDFQFSRFICAHAIMLALEGIPAFYIHSLLATPNDHKKMQRSSNKRAINRHSWNFNDLSELLLDETTLHHQIFYKLRELIEIRKKQAAFHPNATQFTLHFKTSLFAFWRQSQDRSQNIFCIYNISKKPQPVAVKDINLIELDEWTDLISGYQYKDEIITLKPYEFIWISN